MTSKTEILSAIRGQQLPAHELPQMNFETIQYGQPRAKFGEMLSAVGGEAVVVANLADAAARLRENSNFSNASKIVSLVDAVADGTVDLQQVADPHELEDVDFAIVRGEFGVAENGAIWITDEQIAQRAILFIPQHLAIVLPTTEIVHNMHEAYQRLDSYRSAIKEAHQRRFGVFISGPSKTADIEQSLVIGAHGARSLTVFLVDDIEDNREH